MSFKLVKMNTPKSDICILQVIGDLTIYEASEFVEKLISRTDGYRKLHLDLGRIDDFDSAGGQILLSLAKTYSEKGLSFCLIKISNSVENYMKIMGLLNHPSFESNND